MTNTKQLKITKLFRKGASRVTDDCEELQEDIRQLEQQLKEKQDELFQLQRNSYRRRASPLKKKSGLFIRPEKIILNNSIESLKRDLELMSMLSGMEVLSYVVDDHCCIVYHMQHDSEYEVKHGLRIEMKNGVNEVSKSSLPLGFNLAAVLDGFDNVMLPECLGAIRKALVAYYARLEQFEALKKLLNIEAELFRTQDASHVEVRFAAQAEPAEQTPVVLALDYRVYDERPKHYSFLEIDLPEDAVSTISQQCAIFKKKPLHKAFRIAFLDGIGPYNLVRQVAQRLPECYSRRNHKRSRPNNQPYNNDDTFRPEDCSDQSDDEEVYQN